MNNEIDDLKALWKDGQDAEQAKSADTNQLIQLAKTKTKKTTNLLLVNALIMAAVFVILVLYFVTVGHFRETISHIGMILMLGGLGIRIVLELYSAHKASTISITGSAAGMNTKTLAFHQFRKKVHYPFTVIIVVLYSVGVFLLLPELSMYFSALFMVLITIGYLISTAIYSWSIIQAVKKENTYLKEVIRLEEAFRGK